MRLRLDAGAAGHPSRVQLRFDNWRDPECKYLEFRGCLQGLTDEASGGPSSETDALHAAAEAEFDRDHVPKQPPPHPQGEEEPQADRLRNRPQADPRDPYGTEEPKALSGSRNQLPEDHGVRKCPALDPHDDRLWHQASGRRTGGAATGLTQATPSAKDRRLATTGSPAAAIPAPGSENPEMPFDPRNAEERSNCAWGKRCFMPTGRSARPPHRSSAEYQHLIAGLLLHHPLFLGGGAGGGGGLLGGGVGLGVTPSCTFLPGVFRSEGGGFGALTIFQLRYSSSGRLLMNSTITTSEPGINILSR